MKVLSLVVALVTLSVLGSATAQALPKQHGVPNLPPMWAMEQMVLANPAAPAPVAQAYNFEAIVALDDCSGSVVRYETSKDTDLAIVLTNGHCNETGFIDSGKHLYGVSSSRTFALFDSGLKVLGQLTATKIVYATMTLTDITIYQLNETYADIKAKYGVDALVLSSKHPTVGTNIEILSGYWQKGYGCHIDGFVNELHEDQWQWKDSVRYSQPGCDTIGGTSGSPVLQAGTRTVLAINNTGNEDGQKCTMDNPCEVDANGAVTFKQGLDYAEETYIIYSCLNANHEIDLSMPGCQLPK